jgi:hypothetical protein
MARTVVRANRVKPGVVPVIAGSNPGFIRLRRGLQRLVDVGDDVAQRLYPR